VDIATNSEEQMLFEEPKPEDLFSKVIDDCKMEVENIQNFIVGSVNESEENRGQADSCVEETNQSSPESEMSVSNVNSYDSLGECITETGDESEKTENIDDCDDPKDSTKSQTEGNHGIDLSSECDPDMVQDIKTLPENPLKDSSDLVGLEISEKMETEPSEQEHCKEEYTEEINVKVDKDVSGKEIQNSISDMEETLSPNDEQTETICEKIEAAESENEGDTPQQQSNKAKTPTLEVDEDIDNNSADISMSVVDLKDKENTKEKDVEVQEHCSG